MKISIVLGTRPEIIKMASIIDEIKLRGHDLLLIHTGQHYDHEMSDQFFEELELPAPNYNIGVGSGSHGKQTGKMMEGIEKVLLAEKPDILLVQGDTNAVLAGALVASKLHIPVGHVEAGLRSYDNTMPEEINRKAADVCSMFYFVPTEQSGDIGPRGGGYFSLPARDGHAGDRRRARRAQEPRAQQKAGD